MVKKYYSRSGKLCPDDKSACERYYTTKEAAEYLGVSLSSMYKLTSLRAFPVFKPGGKKLYIHIEDLEDWIAAGKRISRNHINKKHQTY